MFTAKKFAANFKGLPVPGPLAELLEFDRKVAGKKFYSDGFEFMAGQEKLLLKSFSEDPAFLDSLLEFACADGTGSTYSIWLKKGVKDLEKAPVVIFGGEGGFHVVASDLVGFIQVLLYDVEPLVDWEMVTYYRDEDEYEPSEAAEAFREWAWKKYRLKEEDADQLVEAAQEQYQEEFLQWVRTYYKEG